MDLFLSGRARGRRQGGAIGAFALPHAPHGSAFKFERVKMTLRMREKRTSTS